MKEWINVEDRLPSHNNAVLAYSDCGTFELLYLPQGSVLWHDQSGDWTIDVTHWMELPEPPK